MKKSISLFLLVLMSISGWGAPSGKVYNTPFSGALARDIASQNALAVNPGMGRLWLMRFYFPKNEVQEEEGSWAKIFRSGDADEQAYATAFYLFNMYVSTATYADDMPARITTNYLGVLDAFYTSRRMFELQDAENFYKKHKNQIKNRLEEFFVKTKNIHIVYDKTDPANDRRELAFMRLLSQAPSYRGRPSYYMDAANKLEGNVSARDVRFITEQLRYSLAQDKDKVVTFEQAFVRGEDLDRKIGIKSSNVLRTYRKVNDECEYCSYEFCKQVCQRVAASNENWGLLRLYKITAAPVAGGSLVPASGARFKLAGGSDAPNWNYHTATLLIMHRGGHFAPVVADKFLAGDAPMPLGKWLALFSSSKTLFHVAPFIRTQKMEGAVKMPQAVKGDNVVVNGLTYSPAPIEW